MEANIYTNLQGNLEIRLDNGKIITPKSQMIFEIHAELLQAGWKYNSECYYM